MNIFQKMQHNAVELCIRLILLVIFIITENIKPVNRVIQPEEWWLYKNPHIQSYVTARYLWIMVMLVPTVVVILSQLYIPIMSKDSIHAFLASTLGLTLNGIITNCIKVTVGRHRPDFFYRCFPDGQMHISPNGIYLSGDVCIGEYGEVVEGCKSFPSGHASCSRSKRLLQKILARHLGGARAHTVSFATFGFVSLFLAGKLRVFKSDGRGSSIRLIFVIMPIVTASLIAISRTIDYHHHWQDVTVGSLLGCAIMFASYHQYYPSAFHRNCHLPYALHNLAPDSEKRRDEEKYHPERILTI